MRKLTSLAAVAALFAAAMLFSAPSQAMTPGTASGVKGAAAAIDPIEKTACWRYGWHGWGWYPCYYGYGYAYPRYGYYGYGYRPYGYYGGWGYRRWGWSDVNLKHDIVPVGHLANGLGLYRFSYNDSDKVYVGVSGGDPPPYAFDLLHREGMMIMDLRPTVLAIAEEAACGVDVYRLRD